MASWVSAAGSDDFEVCRCPAASVRLGSRPSRTSTLRGRWSPSSRTEECCTSRSTAEPVKPDETPQGHFVVMVSSLGSLIQATVGSFGGEGFRFLKRSGLAA